MTKCRAGIFPALILENGHVVARYQYDACGNHIALNESSQVSTEGISKLNPFRYRGYIYDTETGLYYLQTRYYDPEVGRFISQDSIEYADPETINGLNLYAYCNNNPVMNVDPTGRVFLSFLFFSIVFGAVVGGAINTYKAYKEGADTLGMVGAFLGGAIMGGAMGAVMAIGGAAGFASLGFTTTVVGGSAWAAFGISVGIGATAGLLSYSTETLFRKDKSWSWGDFASSIVNGGVQATATFGVSLLGGRAGLFSKSLAKMGGEAFLQQVFNNFGRITTQQAFVYATGMLFTNFVARFLICTVPAAALRLLITKIIKG